MIVIFFTAAGLKLKDCLQHTQKFSTNFFSSFFTVTKAWNAGLVSLTICEKLIRRCFWERRKFLFGWRILHSEKNMAMLPISDNSRMTRRVSLQNSSTFPSCHFPFFIIFILFLSLSLSSSLGWWKLYQRKMLLCCCVLCTLFFVGKFQKEIFLDAMWWLKNTIGK